MDIDIHINITTFLSVIRRTDPKLIIKMIRAKGLPINEREFYRYMTLLRAEIGIADSIYLLKQINNSKSNAIEKSSMNNNNFIPEVKKISNTCIIADKLKVSCREISLN